ncbi:SDR family NAD(P)-dependent oxidoreductase [Planctomyces sp. SH-PL14]|uniref:SDR family NAD(P)-dependent oxidoreductase n=1 Tax=Planctomyces sp. SH-PL14 TaxID=1632864 RepID=UPI00078E5558|nr:SDR family oxidoreductase [Planctomyces sp. SH-PL14]AMV18183.1 3-oxoacyl-[acyl-carrier-protein] reductase FabG [Planctomyces sp. SH-PL14]
MTNPMGMAGRTVLVTGASSGIGRAAAILLSRVGGRVVLVGRDRTRLDETLSAMEGTGHLVFETDLRQADSIPAWMHTVVAESGPLDGLVHSAGNQITVPIRVMDSRLFDKHMDINVHAAGMLIRGFQQAGCFNPAGSSVVLLASTAALAGVPGNSVYAASKGAVISLARALAMELVPKKIRVNCVAPALVRTEMFERYRQSVSEEQRQRYEAVHPLGLGEPEDVANAIVFLLAGTGRWITGTTLVVDGGLTAP